MTTGKTTQAERPLSEQRQNAMIQQVLDLALQHHGAGHLPEAGHIYRQILEAAPDHPVALHLLGVVSHQQDDNERAVQLIGKAVQIKPDFAEAHGNLGKTLKDQGRLDASSR